jgi:hypothetical protein
MWHQIYDHSILFSMKKLLAEIESKNPQVVALQVS